MNEPLPCPVCTEPAEIIFGPDIRFKNGKPMYRAQCSKCLDSPTFTRFTFEQAVEAWNAYVRESL